MQFKYVVTTNEVGKVLTWTISNRENGLAVDLFLFSTNPNLMDTYSQDELDQLLLSGAQGGGGVGLAVSRSGKSVVLSWPAASTGYVLESTAKFPAQTWTAVTTPPTVVGDQNTLSVDASTGTQYYRLRKP